MRIWLQNLQKVLMRAKNSESMLLISNPMKKLKKVHPTKIIGKLLHTEIKVNHSIFPSGFGG
jgi:hypothetical protein